MLHNLNRLALFAALALACCGGIARADQILTQEFTGNLYIEAATEVGVGDSAYGQLCNGCDYSGPATLTYSVDLTQMAGTDCSSYAGSYSECTDSTNNGGVSLTLAFGSYSVTFANNGGLAPHGDNQIGLSSFCTGCTALSIQASNSPTQAPPDGGEMWAGFYNYNDPFDTQSATNADDILAATSDIAYIQGYVGPQFGGGGPDSPYWDYFELSGVQTVDTAAPEPVTWALFMSGLAGVMLYRRR